jgi:hypothetical protein
VRLFDDYIPSATELTAVPLQQWLSSSFASRPRDRFAFLEDDNAADSNARLLSTGAYPRAPRDCGMEKRSFAGERLNAHRWKPRSSNDVRDST